MNTIDKGMGAGVLALLLLTACGGGGSAAGTGGTGGTGGTSAAVCNTSLFSGGVRDATSAELTTYGQTYTGNTGTFDNSFNFIPDAALTLVFGASGTLTYNTQSQTVSSICYETAVPQLVVHYGASGHVDLNTNGSFTGVGPDGTTIIKSGTVPSGTSPAVSGFTPATGAVGTTVTISGTNLGHFTPAPMVKFGTTVATVSSATATSIVVTVPNGLAAGNSTITLSNFDGTGVVTVGTFNVTVSGGGGGGAGSFPNEAITLPSTTRNAISSPTIAATDLSSMVGTYTAAKASYETNVLISDYTTGTTLNSCDLSFAADRTVTLTSGAHTYTQVIDGTNNDVWSPSLTAGEVNTGNLHAGPQTPGAGVTEIGIVIGRGKVLSVMAEIVADPFTPFTPMTERLTCWMPINRTVGTAGASWTQWLSFGSASDMPTTVTGSYAGSLVSDNNVAAPPGSTCQLAITADGTMTFSTTGAATDVSFAAQIAGDREDRVGYTDSINWNLRAKDISNQIDGTYNVITLQNVAGTLMVTAGQGTVRPVTSAGYACTSVVKQ